MPSISTTAAILTLGLATISQALRPIILADTNRDGRIDEEGGSDLAGKEFWTEKVGALFLANIGDTNRRCSTEIKVFEKSGSNTPDEDLDRCNDASDNKQRNPKYLAPLKTTSMPSLSESATGSIAVLEDAAIEKVRIFPKSGSDWIYIASNYSFTSQELKNGLELGVDARDVRRPGGWDGRATIQFTVSDGAETGNDSVALRVAPVLTHHHLQLASEILTSEPYSNGAGSKFVQDLQVHVQEAGIQKPVRLLRGDAWVQDRFEPGYTSIPGPDGPIMLRVNIRSAVNDTEGKTVFSDLRSDSVGAVQELVFENTDTDVDHMRNLETIPPHTHNGKSYPAGRVVMGSRYGRGPNILKFLAAQETQSPLEIDTSWLYIGHTDEFMQFITANNKRGWAMMVDDPHAGFGILEKAQKAGHGNASAMSRPSFPTDSTETRFTKTVDLPRLTIDALLSKANFSKVQDYAAVNIQKNIDIMKREVGLTDAEIFRVPALYYNEGLSGPRQYQPVRYLPGPGQEEEFLKDPERTFQVYSLYPGTINGIVFGNTEYLAPNPLGPIVDGRDILREAVTRAYAKAQVKVNYIDDWFSYHLGVGEIHCGSNAIRDPGTPWW